MDPMQVSSMSHTTSSASCGTRFNKVMRQHVFNIKGRAPSEKEVIGSMSSDCFRRARGYKQASLRRHSVTDCSFYLCRSIWTGQAHQSSKSSPQVSPRASCSHHLERTTAMRHINYHHRLESWDRVSVMPTYLYPQNILVITGMLQFSWGNSHHSESHKQIVLVCSAILLVG